MPKRPISKREADLRRAFAREDYLSAASLARSWLRDEPDSAWLWIQHSDALYEMHHYRSSMRSALRASKINPQEPLVHWALGGCAEMLGRYRDAERHYRHIIREGDARVGTKFTQEGLAWGRALVNDARFRLGTSYSASGNYKGARRWLKAHLRYRRRGDPSLYRKREVESELRDVLAHL